MKKLLVLFGIGALVYFLVKDRLGGAPEEFVFTEAPVDDAPVQADHTAPAEG